MAERKKLTPKEAIFVQEYLIDLNASRAAVSAGYSEERANQTGYDLTHNSLVMAAVQEAMDARAVRTGITQDRVLAELALLGFSNMLDYVSIGGTGDPFVDLSNISREQAAALSEVTVDDFVDGRGEDARDVKRVRVKIADKRAALVDIGKHLGMFKERVEHSGPDGGPIQTVGIATNDPVEAARIYREMIAGEK